MASEAIQVRAEGWNSYIERQIEPRWSPVLRAWFPPDGGYNLDWHWKFLQYVFRLDDPREFPQLQSPRWTPDERIVVDRFLSHCRDLAATTVLSARDGYHVSMPTLDSEPEITDENSPRDATVGYLTMFRQLYAPQEEASFKRAHDLVGREMHREGTDLRPLRVWRGVQGTLRHTHLDHLIW